MLTRNNKLYFLSAPQLFIVIVNQIFLKFKNNKNKEILL